MTRPVDLIICFAGPALSPSNKPLFPYMMSDIPTWRSKLQYKTGFFPLYRTRYMKPIPHGAWKRSWIFFIWYLFMPKTEQELLFQTKSTFLNFDFHHFRSFGKKWPDLKINLIDNDVLQPSCCKIAKCWLSIL